MRVWIETKREKRKWWFGYKTLYCVCTEYMSWPHQSKAEAYEVASIMRMYLQDV